MKFPRLALVLALIFAAAVLFPLRRARGAFRACATTSGFSNAPRVSLRRRPGGQRPDLRGQAATPSLFRANSGPSAAQAPRPAPILSAPQVERSSHPVADVVDERIVERFASEPGLEPLDTPVPPDRPLAATQVVGEIPEPPPKSRA